MRISDWSSDVCSSDLGAHSRARGRDIALRLRELSAQLLVQRVEPRVLVAGGRRAGSGVIALLVQPPLDDLPLVPAANDVRVAVGEIQQQSSELVVHLVAAGVVEGFQCLNRCYGGLSVPRFGLRGVAR